MTRRGALVLVLYFLLAVLLVGWLSSGCIMSPSKRERSAVKLGAPVIARRLAHAAPLVGE